MQSWTWIALTIVVISNFTPRVTPLTYWVSLSLKLEVRFTELWGRYWVLYKQINLGNLESMNLGLPKLCNVLTIISCILYIVTIDVPYKSLKLKPLCAQGWPRGAGHALGLFEFVDFQGKLLDKSPCLESDQRNHDLIIIVLSTAVTHPLHKTSRCWNHKFVSNKMKEVIKLSFTTELLSLGQSRAIS